MVAIIRAMFVFFCHSIWNILTAFVSENNLLLLAKFITFSYFVALIFSNAISGNVLELIFCGRAMISSPYRRIARLSTFIVNCVRLMSNNVAVLRTGIAAFENRM